MGFHALKDPYVFRSGSGDSTKSNRIYAKSTAFGAAAPSVVLAALTLFFNLIHAVVLDKDCHADAVHRRWSAHSWAPSAPWGKHFRQKSTYIF